MNISIFIENERKRLEEFEAHWIKNMEKDPHNYTDDLDEEDWNENYISWRDD